MNGKEVAEKIGVTYPQLRYFVRKIDAVSKKDTSQGHEHDFTFRDLVYLKLASVMRSDGIGLDEINQAVGTLDYFLDVMSGYMKDGVFVKQKDVSYRGGLVKTREGVWSYGLGEYDDENVAFYYDPKSGKEGSYKKTSLSHVPGFYYSVRAIVSELIKGDQLELNLMSEVVAVK